MGVIVARGIVLYRAIVPKRNRPCRPLESTDVLRPIVLLDELRDQRP